MAADKIIAVSQDSVRYTNNNNKHKSFQKSFVVIVSDNKTAFV